MPVYDLMLKLEGMKALCGDGMTDNDLSMALFYHKWEEEFKAAKPGTETRALEKRASQSQRSDLSRLKSGGLEFTQRLKSILTEDFNARIVKNVLGGNTEPDGTGLLRNEDWERPIHELFGRVAPVLEKIAPTALTRAHAAIIQAMRGLEEYRESDHALLVADYDPNDAQGYRFPSASRPVDPWDLPPAPIRSGQQMVAALVHEITRQPARGWLFYIRNPDERRGSSQARYMWDQDLSEIVYWHPGGAFTIPARYTGLLPGFPTEAAALLGEVTAYLLVEPLESSAVEAFLRGPDPAWKSDATPSFEGFANLVTGKKRLFQHGNVARQEDGRVNYPPPKLYMRRYKVT